MEGRAGPGVSACVFKGGCRAEVVMACGVRGFVTGVREVCGRRW